MIEKTFHTDFILTAADCNAQRELSPANLTNLIIETATGHANALGVGFDRMIADGITWVLSRVSIELSEPTRVGRRYRLLTWVHSINRLFSERDFELIDLDDDRAIGFARTIWMAINMETRAAGDLSALTPLADAVIDRPCPIAPQGKLAAPDPDETAGQYTFAVSDIDVNRHVTTRRYVELLLNCWPLDMYEQNFLSRIDIAFKREARYGQTAIYAGTSTAQPGVMTARIDADGNTCTLASLVFTPRSV